MQQKSSKFSKISNIIFIESIVFILSYIWVNFYLKRILLSFFISFTLTLLISLIFFYFKSKINKKKQNKINEIEHKLKLKNYLKLNKRNITNNYLISKFKFTNLKKIDNNHYHNKTSNFDVFIFLNIDEFNEYKVYNNHISNKITIISIDEIKLNYILKNTSIQIIQYEEIYQLCKADFENLIPNIIEEKQKSKFKLKELIPQILVKKNYKKFFSLGMLLIFSSILTKYKIYYLLISTLLLLTSIYCRFNTKFNNK